MRAAAAPPRVVEAYRLVSFCLTAKASTLSYASPLNFANSLRLGFQNWPLRQTFGFSHRARHRNKSAAWAALFLNNEENGLNLIISTEVNLSMLGAVLGGWMGDFAW